MSDYIATLEAQNEDLRHRLAVAEEYIAWKDARHLNKLDFAYALYTETDQKAGNTPMKRQEFRIALRELNRDGAKSYIAKHFPERKTIDRLSLVLYGSARRDRFYVKTVFEYER